MLPEQKEQGTLGTTDRVQEIEIKGEDHDISPTETERQMDPQPSSVISTSPIDPPGLISQAVSSQPVRDLSQSPVSTLDSKEDTPTTEENGKPEVNNSTESDKSNKVETLESGKGTVEAPEEEPVSALQLARMAYRAMLPIKNAKLVHPSSTSTESNTEDSPDTSTVPVELSLPPPSVTRSKHSGKLTASQKLMSGKLKPTGAAGGKMDSQTREDKERAASDSIRASMGKGGPLVIKFPKSHFKSYSMAKLQAAMDHFWPNHILGEGSYGIVYRGMLENMDVAIKQLKNPDTKLAMEEIEREIEVQKRCDHPNLVKLLGYSDEDRSLVYEYLSNGSLEDRLLCMGGSPPLLWPDRCRIAMEVAAALQHLHTRTPAIVHRDVKPANVLLDDNFVAKLGDVGLARLMDDMQNGNTHIVRKSVIVGTEHYVDPEYLCARRGYLGPKSDVYSFGIVLLQLLVGGIPNLRKIDMAVEQDKLQGLLDPKAGLWPIALATDLANLGLWCSEMDRKDRPDLEEEVIPALLEICEAAAVEIMAVEANNQKAKDEQMRKEEAARILEEEKALSVMKAAQEAARKAAAEKAGAAQDLAMRATLPPPHQEMSKTEAVFTKTGSPPSQESQPAPSKGCC